MTSFGSKIPHKTEIILNSIKTWYFDKRKTFLKAYDLLVLFPEKKKKKMQTWFWVWPILTLFLPKEGLKKASFTNLIFLAGQYSYAMLGTSRTTLLRVFTYKMLAKEYRTILNRIFSYALLSWDPKTTLHKVFPVQCCSRRWYSWCNIAHIKTLCIVAL